MIKLLLKHLNGQIFPELYIIIFASQIFYLKVKFMRLCVIVSRCAHRWTLDLFLKGAKTDLEESDIYQPLKEDESEKVTDHLEM